jgi:ferredoxin-nitrate reductase
MTQFKTTCCYCGVGCGINITPATDGKFTVSGDPTHPSNRGMLCSKGMNLHYTAWDKSDRLLHPEMRWSRSQPRERVTWDVALERTAAVFKTFIDRFGADSVGFYASGQMLTEEYYVVNKLIKGFIGSNNIDTNSRLCMSSAVVGYKLALGEDSVPVCYDDIELADCFLVAGANPAWNHPIIWRRVEAHKAANPSVKIINIDPRTTDSARSADLHLAIKPATDITLLNAIARILIENAWIDSDFISQYTEGYEKLKAKAFERTVEEAAAICDVPAEDICLAAKWIGQSKGFISMWAMGFNQSVIGVDKNLSLINLHLITGQIGRAGAGPLSLTGQPNAMGGREVGGLSNLLPAHRNLLNPEHRAEVERFWGTPQSISPKNGLTATEMFEALEDGRMKAIWIICTNPLVSLPDVRRVEAALKKAKFVVVQDMSNRPETLEYADVVLPAATWTEKEGTMTNSERRVSYLHKITPPPSEALPDTEIIVRFAEKMGFGNAFDFYKTDAQTGEKRFYTEGVFLEHAALTKGTNVDMSGLNYSILQKYGTVQWTFTEDDARKLKDIKNDIGDIGDIGDIRKTPDSSNLENLDVFTKFEINKVNNFNTPSISNESFANSSFITHHSSFPNLGTKRLFEDKKFYTPSGKAQIFGCNDENLSEATTPQYPLVLTTARIRDQWHTMSRTGKVNKLNQHIPKAELDIHPEDAAKRGIYDGDLVEITNARGSVKVAAKLTTDIRKGVVCLPMHWGKIEGNDAARANNITNNLVDSRSKEPDFKFVPVEVVRFMTPKRKIIVVGAGAAAFSFVQNLRQQNDNTDEITVFSREPQPFYNRVMLPDYVSGAQTFPQLLKMTDRDNADTQLIIYQGCGVQSIDRAKKTITDDFNKIHDYDLLILATGSRANMPREVPRHLKNIFNMRTKADADNLLQTIENQSNVVIVGGGLLGLEMAGALREIGVKVTVIHRSSRLMDRQLDTLGSGLLHQEIVSRGVDIFYNDQIQTFFGKEQIEAVRLRSGQKIECSAIIYAVGTIPNVEIARSAGLDCNRGVRVDSFMQTSDPSVYALGEIAEWRGTMWGITAAAEEQAEIAAKFIAGDVRQPYKGSLSMNILKFSGLQLCSIGRVEVPVDDPNFEEIIFVDKAKRYYKKCIVQNDKLIGAILIGDKTEFLEFKNLIQNGIELSEKRLDLLRSGKKAEPVLGKLVCACNGVGQGNLEAKIRGGCTDFTQLCSETGAGSGCGSCRTEVKMILENAVLCTT